jgi:hypothetical protein
MKNTNQTYKQTNEKLKTLCTLDCSDVVIFNETKNPFAPNKTGYPFKNKRKSHFKSYTKNKNATIERAYSSITPKSCAKKPKFQN